MKKKAEFIIAALTLMFLCFSIGYFIGRRSVPTSVSVSAGTVLTQADEDSPSPFTASAFYDEPSPISAGTPAPVSAPASAPISTPTPAPVASAAAQTEPDLTPTPTPTSEETEQDAAESHYDEQGRLRINYATQAELETLPGIGPALASRIIEFRDANGGFNRLTTLKSISGIGDKRYDAICDLITVE